jgi:hypothetical protein
LGIGYEILLDDPGVRDDRYCCRCWELLGGSSLPSLFRYLSPCTIVYWSCFNECKQAYVGYASDINAIVVVFRGTQENRYIAYISLCLVLRKMLFSFQFRSCPIQPCRAATLPSPPPLCRRGPPAVSYRGLCTEGRVGKRRGGAAVERGKLRFPSGSGIQQA